MRPTGSSAAWRPDPPVRLGVLDEMRHGLPGFTRRVLGLPGHRPVVPPSRDISGAGLHRTDGDPGLPDNLRVVTLPAYSPEPNPIEDSLCNRASDTLAELEAVLLTGLHRVRSPPSSTGSWLKQTLLPDPLY